MQAILDTPGDDSLRLIAADACEEAGDLARAEFVRVQLRIAAVCHTGLRDCGGYYCETYDDGTTSHRDCWYARALRREQELLSFHYMPWTRPLPTLPAVDTGKDLLAPYTFHRGFVAEVRCRLADWKKHGPQVVACQPIVSLILTDREPHWNGRFYCWYNPDRRRPSDDVPEAANVPEDVLRFVTGTAPGETVRYTMFPNKGVAVAALMRGTLLWAKSQKS